LPLKFVKSADMKRKKCQKCNMDFKNTEFDADFDFIEKAAKNRMGNEKVKEK
jgi:hypothetical protein